MTRLHGSILNSNPQNTLYEKLNFSSDPDARVSLVLKSLCHATQKIQEDKVFHALGKRSRKDAGS